MKPIDLWLLPKNGELRAVLQDPESYENMHNAIGILKLISQGETDVRGGRTQPQDTLFAEIEGSLRKA